MKMDFDDIFYAKPLSEMEVQDVVIQELNKSLPSEDIEYVSCGDGFCSITTKKDKLTIGGFVINLDDEDRKILGDRPKIDDILDYSYNAQKPMRLKLQEENIILVNGERIHTDKLIYKPLSNISCKNGHFCAIPEKFPGPFLISIHDDVYSHDFMMQRIPNKSIANMVFESEDNQILKLKYIIYKKEEKMTFNVSYNFKYSESIEDLIKYSTLYNSFLSGKVKIKESILKGEGYSGDNIIDVDVINYWKKIRAIEKCFNLTFDPAMIEMTRDEQEIVNELFYGVVKSFPIRDYNSYSSFSITFNGEKDAKELKIGQMMYFGFEANREFNLLGQVIELYCSIGIYNSKVKDVVSLENQTKVVFENIDEKRKLYIVVKYFTSQDALSTYRDCLSGEDVATLGKAKRVIEYIKEE